jgi:hypothetical protein
VKYFFDNCISFRFAGMLSALDKEVTSLRDEFAESVQDREFIAALQGSHDVYITYDHKQKTREAEAAAIKDSGVTALLLGPFWGNLVFWDQAKWLINKWERIEDFAGSVVPGTCAEIKQNGRALVFHL